jgi:hypothetical protein
VELLQTAGKPDDGYRRKTALTGFSEAKAVPRDFGIADFFAIGFYDSAYPELLKHIPGPPHWFFFASVIWRCWSNAVLPWLVPVKVPSQDAL